MTCKSNFGFYNKKKILLLAYFIHYIVYSHLPNHQLLLYDYISDSPKDPMMIFVKAKAAILNSH